jgi:hypothetical protein
VLWGTIQAQRFSAMIDAEKEIAKGQELDLFFSPRDVSLFGSDGKRL